LLCHKPCTVSGGGKSEISKSITDAILTGPVFVADLKSDIDKVAKLINRDYSDRFDKIRSAWTSGRSSQPRPLPGFSVIKLLTPDERRLHPRLQRLAGERVPNTSRNSSSW
jgi:hypothetical protein